MKQQRGLVSTQCARQSFARRRLATLRSLARLNDLRLADRGNKSIEQCNRIVVGLADSSEVLATSSTSGLRQILAPATALISAALGTRAGEATRSLAQERGAGTAITSFQHHRLFLFPAGQVLAARTGSMECLFPDTQRRESTPQAHVQLAD